MKGKMKIICGHGHVSGIRPGLFVWMWLIKASNIAHCEMVTPLDWTFEERECPDFTSIDPDIFLSSMKVALGSPDRAFLTVPSGLEIQSSLLPDAGFGVISELFIPRHTWLGEYEGEYLPLGEHKLAYAWSIYVDTEEAYYVDAYNVRSANWLRFVNCARHVSEQNVGMSQCYGKVYYRTLKDVAPGQELLVYYGDNYAENTLGLDVDNYNKRTSNVTLVYQPASSHMCVHRPAND